jgi:hypothetical protein
VNVIGKVSADSLLGGRSVFPRSPRSGLEWVAGCCEGIVTNISWDGGKRTRACAQSTRRPCFAGCRAAKIDWISDRRGDGTGYDLLSYDASEVGRFIEVKTTNGGASTPFIVTKNELDFSEDTEDAFCLYRVFEFASAPKLFILRGAISANLELEALDYRARLKSIGWHLVCLWSVSAMKNWLKTLELTPSLAEAALRVFHFIGNLTCSYPKGSRAHPPTFAPDACRVPLSTAHRRPHLPLAWAHYAEPSWVGWPELAEQRHAVLASQNKR